MSYETIRKLLDQKPFIPFEVVLSSGAKYRVTHPEIVVANKGGLVIAYPDAQTFDICSLLHITAIHTLPVGQPS
ncbi:MAG: hypothetical protein SFU86_15910 [Pirellulaceae bacterium]|nr:hypothetical protein [Pirellulaceae bacterium]